MMAKIAIIDAQGNRNFLELKLERTSIGRSTCAQIVIADDEASRHHAVIVEHEEGYLLVDLDSRNGTSLNQQPVKKQEILEDGDIIKIASTTMEFQVFPTPKPIDLRSPNQSPEEYPNSVVLCRIDLSKKNEKLIKVNPEAKLSAILELNQAIGQTLKLNHLLPQMTSCLMQLFSQADRVLVILRNKDGELYAHSAQSRDPQDPTPNLFSRTVVNTAFQEKQAILSADATTDSRFSDSNTLANIKMRSLICAPLLGTGNQPLGVIQIENKKSAKLLTEEDLHLLTILTAVSAVAIEKADIHEQNLKQKQVEQELNFAREVQRGLLPGSLPPIPGYSTWSFYEPAGQVGGDFYDVLELPNGSYAIIVADVSGKGVPAALMMARASSETRVGILSSPDNLAHAMGNINRAICHARLPGHFLTMAVCILEPQTGTLTMATAGHMSPILKHNDTRPQEPVIEDIGGIPIGVSNDWHYGISTVTLQPEEKVLLYTDGITEAMNEKNEMYGKDRLLDKIQAIDKASSTSELGESIISDVRTHVAQGMQNDDITLLILGCDS
ncbi:MAG: SpoIIE family protein phosphatase [Myxococcota bacterium]|nr:SpoIIE family protein phosphatase [Myxococcota bacterium]